jgi:putative N6-adenine-specific DNA methylase
MPDVRPVHGLETGEQLEGEAAVEAGRAVECDLHGFEQEELAAFYPQLGSALKKHWAGWNCFFFTADLRLPKLVGLKPSRKTPLFNGPLECRLFEIRMVAGSNRKV